MNSVDMLSWYETTLPSGERKRRGHFSTPPLLVEQILDACGYTPEKDLSHIRVLDPACGSGNFLAGVLRRLIASEKEHERTLTSVQRNIWGLDPDPVACFLAEMQLSSIFAEEFRSPFSPRTGGLDLSPRLISPQKRVARQGEPGPFHIHQADGLVLPWERCEPVDLFLANPPYLAAKNTDLSGYRSAHGQTDSYLLFLRLALQVVRPGGWIGLVLPDPLLARSNAARERQSLLAETTVHQLWHLAGVFAAYVGAVVIVAQKQPTPPLHHISWRREKWSMALGRPLFVPGLPADLMNSPAELAHSNPLAAVQVVEDEGRLSRTSTIPQELLCMQPGSELRYLLSCVRGSLLARLQAQVSTVPAPSDALVPLREIVTIRRGEELSKASPLLSNNHPVDGEIWHPVLRGGIDIRPYHTPLGRYWLAATEIRKPLTHYQAPKLLVVKSTGNLQATLDLHGHVVLQTLYLLNLRLPDDHERNGSGIVEDYGGSVQLDELYFLLALLNSRLLREYVQVMHTAYKWVQPQIEQHILAELPVPVMPSDEREAIIQRAKRLMGACSQISPVVELKESKALYEEQERAICRLYETALSLENPVGPTR